MTGGGGGGRGGNVPEWADGTTLDRSVGGQSREIPGMPGVMAEHVPGMPGVASGLDDRSSGGVGNGDGDFRGYGGNDRRGGGGGFGRDSRGGNRRQSNGHQRHNHRNRSAKLMTSDEIEQILRIQWAATHPLDRPAYEHDYYYQN